MGHSLINDGSCDPETLKLLDRAFDEVWQDIGGNYGVDAAENRRTRLAEIILELARNGERDLIDLKYMAVEIMRHKERPISLNTARHPRPPDQNHSVCLGAGVGDGIHRLRARFLIGQRPHSL